MEIRDPNRESTAERQSESSRIVLRFEKFSSFVDEYASFLSLGGMFLATPALRPVGQTVGFAIELTDGFRLVEGVGEVVWLRPRDSGPGNPAGMALRFQALDENGRQLILKILEEQVKSGGAPFEVDELPVDAISIPGVVPEPPPPTVAGEDRSPRALEFDAPWGKELPSLPEEILDDTGSLAEASRPPVVAPVVEAPAVGEAEAPAVEEEAPAVVGEQAATAAEPVTGAVEAAASEPPAAAKDGSFRLAFEAASELESLPELSPPPSPELDDDDRARDLSLELPADPPGKAASFFAPLAGAPDAPAVELRSEDSGAFGQPSAGDPAIESAAVAAGVPAGTADLHAVDPGPADPRPAEPRPAVSESAAVHGAVLDYEEELAGTRGRGAGRNRPVSKLGAGIAALAVVLIAVAAGWWVWGNAAPAPPASSSAPSATAAGNEDVEAVVGRPELESGSQPAAGHPSETAAGEDVAAGLEPRASTVAAAAEPQPALRPESPPPTRSSRQAASTVREISWQTDDRGTWVSILFDGETDPGRVRHDRLEWAAAKEQISLVGIELPYLPATVAVGTSELVRIRTGLHATGGPPELRLVFDLTSAAVALDVPQVSGDRLRVLVHRGSL